MTAGPKPLHGLRRDSGLALTERYPSAGPAPSLSRIEVRWRVSRRSLGVHAPGGDSQIVDLTVDLLIRPSIEFASCPGSLHAQAGVTVTVTDPTSGHASVLRRSEGVAVEVIDDIRSEIHVEAPGVLHATVTPGLPGPSDLPGAPSPSASAGQWRLVYARTPVLADLGVPGGRAETAGVLVEA